MKWYGWIAVQFIWIIPTMAQDLNPQDMKAAASAIVLQKERCEQNEIMLSVQNTRKIAELESQKATLIEWLKVAQEKK